MTLPFETDSSWLGIKVPELENRVALETAWILLMSPAHFITSRGAVDRTKIRHGHWQDIYALSQAFTGMSLEECDAAVLEFARRRRPVAGIDLSSITFDL